MGAFEIKSIPSLIADNSIFCPFLIVCGTVPNKIKAMKMATGHDHRTLLQVTVDAVYGNVYEGVVEELFTGKKTDDVMKASPALKRLKDILKMITPVGLGVFAEDFSGSF